ncbi:hypothetical protein BV22DRAFT_1039606 [Leucogyrophana mollusca]|uniref:Uncharacterized protein n=1 Tax=Leucogyrophana mollusca TaxID=85980 RepID=A0ACB8B559_9AGAM|nr:hypothetical protein BV22DRAFT_1039606 [Leucogyrophana mollusca]
MADVSCLLRPRHQIRVKQGLRLRSQTISHCCVSTKPFGRTLHLSKRVLGRSRGDPFIAAFLLRRCHDHSRQRAQDGTTKRPIVSIPPRSLFASPPHFPKDVGLGRRLWEYDAKVALRRIVAGYGAGPKQSYMG